jgi:hypothetical protein
MPALHFPLKSYLPAHRLTSRIMDPIKALGRMGIIGGFVNNFDGEPYLADFPLASTNFKRWRRASG